MRPPVARNGPKGMLSSRERVLVSSNRIAVVPTIEMATTKPKMTKGKPVIAPIPAPSFTSPAPIVLPGVIHMTDKIPNPTAAPVAAQINPMPGQKVPSANDTITPGKDNRFGIRRLLRSTMAIDPNTRM